MLNKFFYFIISFIIWAPAWATDCLLNEALKNPALSSNPKFWEELSQLSEKGKPSDADIKALMGRHGGLEGGKLKVEDSSFKKPVLLSMDHKAEKEIQGLPKNLKSKVDEFLEMALEPGGMKELRENPGRWHLEKLKANGAYTVRLNEGYRVLFEYSDKGLKVLRVNKGQIHGI